MPRRLLMRRQFLGHTGGHQKMFDYFQHAAAHSGWSPSVYFTDDSVTVMNPWRSVGTSELTTWQPGRADALLLGGMDWAAIQDDAIGVPVINLIQHVRHADPGLPLRGFLSRRALRICVSEPVAEAIVATGEVNGPVRVIEAGISDIKPAMGPRAGVFIDAIKQPELGHALARALEKHGLAVNLSRARIERTDYLARLGRCEIAVLLPHATEGFYLPGVEAMAAGAACVVPDCIGNRGYLRPSVNALVPSLDLESVQAAVMALQDPALRDIVRSGAAVTSQQYSLARERRAFHDVLDELEIRWTV